MDKFWVETYDHNGKLIRSVEVDNSMQGLFELGKDDGFNYVHATCYHRMLAGNIVVQWELEIK